MYAPTETADGAHFSTTMTLLVQASQVPPAGSVDLLDTQPALAHYALAVAAHASVVAGVYVHLR